MGAILVANCTIVMISLGAEAFGQARFGAGAGQIWLDNVQCVGTENKLINCRANSIGFHSCTHGQDAGVRCPPGKIDYNI